MPATTLSHATVDALVADLQITNRDAFVTGVSDGTEQGPELSMGMTYEDEKSQQDYDAGSYIGAAVFATRSKHPYYKS